jgi:hypothetical protein
MPLRTPALVIAGLSDATPASQERSLAARASLNIDLIDCDCHRRQTRPSGPKPSDQNHQSFHNRSTTTHQYLQPPQHLQIAHFLHPAKDQLKKTFHPLHLLAADSFRDPIFPKPACCFRSQRLLSKQSSPLPTTSDRISSRHRQPNTNTPGTNQPIAPRRRCSFELLIAA